MLRATAAARAAPRRLRVGTPVSIKGKGEKPSPQAVESGAASVFGASIGVPLASGRITRAVADNVFLIEFDRENIGPRRLFIGDRVWRKIHPGEVIQEGAAAGGKKPKNDFVCPHCDGDALEANADAASKADEPKPERVSAVVLQHNNSGTYAVMDDQTDMFHASVGRRDLSRQATSSPIGRAGKPLDQLAQWLREKGVLTKRHAYIAACSLYRRGWRDTDVHLVDNHDIHCMRNLPRPARQAIVEAAMLEKDMLRARREISKENVLENDWRYFLSKYSRVWGVCVAMFGACSATMWNFKNNARTLRPTQVDIARAAWLGQDAPHASSHTVAGSHHAHNSEATVRRTALERLRKIFRDVDPLHPRVTVVSGNVGVGKSSLIRAAAQHEKLPTVFVELRGDTAADPITALVKSLKVPHIGVCGGLFAFVEDVATAVRDEAFGAHGSFRAAYGGGGVTGTGTGSGTPLPLIVFKVRDGACVDQVFRDAAILGCDRRVAHVVIEVTSEHGKLALLRRERTEVLVVSEFSNQEAREYVGKRVDPVALEEFMEVVGTNSSDLDEFIAATTHRNVDPFDFIASKLQRTIADFRTLPLAVQRTLGDVAAAPYREGLALPIAETEAVPHLLDSLQYIPHHKAFAFRTRARYTAAQVVTAPDARRRIDFADPAMSNTWLRGDTAAPGVATTKLTAAT